MTEYNCVICYNKDCSVTTNCGHQFCDECLIKWIKDNPTCPYCRHPFNEQERQDIFLYRNSITRATRSKTYSHRKKHTTNTLKEMLDKFVIIPTRKDQIIEAKNICKFMYNSISYYKKDTKLINTFIEKIIELENDGIKECSIIRFKLRERNII
jgi:hypothetical protein